MYNCESCHDLFLDYLYDLLEPAQAEPLRAHLAGCPACREALAAAERQQKLLARAAQVYAHVPVFAPPSSEADRPAPAAPARDEPPTLPLPARRKVRLLRWAGAAVAAALLAGAAGLYGLYQSGLSERRQELADARDQVAKIRTQLTSGQAELKHQLAEVPGTLRPGYFTVQADGPAVYRPGAAARYHVITRDLDDRLLNAEVSARLVDAATKQVVFEEKALQSRGELTLTLPADLKVRPGSAARLELEARSGGAAESLRQDLIVRAPAYLTQLVLNKSDCRTGETLFFRSLTLDRFSLRPPEQPLELHYTLAEGRGRVVRQLVARSGPAGVAGGQFTLTPDLAAGDYTLEVVAPAAGALGVAPQTRRLTVRHDQAPELVLDRDQYRPGDTVNATLRARRAANGAPAANQAVTVKAAADGRPVPLPGAAPGQPLQTATDKEGKAVVRVPLPAGLKKGRVLLEAQFHDGLRNESVRQPVPVALTGPAVEFFPEGGDLVAGLPGRVYFRVQTPPGQPARLEGKVVDGRGRAVAEVRTEPAGKLAANEALGVFPLTPEAGQAYRLQITAPPGVKEEPALPAVRQSGVVLTVPQAVVREDEPIRSTVRATGAGRTLLVLAECRGQVVDERFVTAGKDGTEVRLDPVAGTRGVVRVTAYETDQRRLVPVAERLVYREPAERLALSFAEVGRPAGQPHHPGNAVELEVRAATEAGKATRASALAAVINQQGLEGTDKQGEAGPPAYFYLASAVPQAEHLEDANLLVGDGAKARAALELFLGSYGWRRFVRAEPGPLLAAAGPAGPAVFHLSSAGAVRERYATALAARQDALKHDADLRRALLVQEQEQHERAARRAALALADFERLPAEYLRLGLGVLALALLAVGGVALAVGLVRALRRSAAPTACFATAFASLALCLLLYGLTGGLRGNGPQGRGDAIGPMARNDDQAHNGNRGVGEEGLMKRAPAGDGLPSGIYRGARERAAARELMAEQTRGTGKRDSAPDLARAQRRQAEAKQETFGSNDRAEPRVVAGRKTGSAKGKAPGAGTAGGAARPLVMPPAAPLPPGGARGGPDSPPPRPAVPAIATAAAEHGSAFRSDVSLREYARPPDTVLWQPALEIRGGRARVGFILPDVAATYRVLLYGHDGSGRLGFAEGTLLVQPARR
jgi:hypothetical protein